MNKQQKQTEKHTLKAMAIVMLWFIILWTLMSIIGCHNHNNCAHEDVYIPRDTIIHKDNVMDSIEMDCGGEYHGKEGKSEYGEYEPNE